MEIKLMVLIPILFLTGCEVKKCKTLETKKEIVMLPMLIGITNNMPQYIHVPIEQDVDYCSEYYNEIKPL